MEWTLEKNCILKYNFECINDMCVYVVVLNHYNVIKYYKLSDEITWETNEISKWFKQILFYKSCLNINVM